MEAGPRPLAGRYRFARRMEGARGAVVWFAVDERTGSPVVAAVLPPERVTRAVQASVGVRHPRLASILDLFRGVDRSVLPPGFSSEDPSVLVAEHVAGDMLLARIQEGDLPRRDAVLCIHDLAGPLAALHREGAFHGSVSPLSVVLSRADGGEGPVLTQLLMPALPDYASPERVSGRGASIADDVWALHAVLHAAVLGKPPLPGRKPFDLKRTPGAEIDALLEDTLLRGLDPSPERRTKSVEDLEADLVVWLSQNTARTPDPPVRRGPPPLPPEPPAPDPLELAFPDAPAADPLELALPEAPPPDPAPSEPAVAEAPPSEPSTPIAHSTSPAPAPAPSEPAALPPAPVPRAPKRPRPRIGPLAQVALAASMLGGMALASRVLRTPAPAPAGPVEQISEPLPPAATSIGAALPPVDSQEPPLPPAPSGSASPNATKCIEGLFPPRTILVPQDLSFVCGPADARTAVKTLSHRFVAGGADQSTPGMKEWVKLDWYQLAAYGVMRGKCCPGAPPVNLPPSTPPCENVGPTLDRLADAVRTGKDVDLRVLAFDKNVTCLHGQHARPYRYTDHPWSGGQVAFAEFLKRSVRAGR